MDFLIIMLSRESEIISKAICAAIDSHNKGSDVEFIKEEIDDILSDLDKVPVKIYCESPDDPVPEYAHGIEDTCMDLRARWIERKVDRIICHTGIHIELPSLHQLNIYPRSNLSKTGWYIPNTPGIGDSGYRGEILVVFRPVNGMDREEFPYKEGDRVAQCQVVKYQEVIWNRVSFLDDLTPSKRGDGGYSSTGKS